MIFVNAAIADDVRTHALRAGQVPSQIRVREEEGHVIHEVLVARRQPRGPVVLGVVTVRLSTNGEIFATRLSPAGAVLDVGGLRVGSGTSSTVAFDGTQYLIAWAYGASSSGNAALHARRMLPSGAFVDATPLLVAKESGGRLAAVSLQGQFIVSWMNYNTVRASKVPSGIPVTLATAPSSQYIEAHTLASDGHTALSVWSVETASGYSWNWARSLWARHITPDGSLPQPAFQLLDLSPQYEDSSPALAVRGARQWALAYSRMYPSSPLGNVRTVLRTLVPAPQGSACGADFQCQGGFCVDGVCCNAACGGGSDNDCQACSVAKGAAADGTCGTVARGALCRPSAGVCDVAEVCDGTAPSCPADAAASDGTTCDDGNACTQTDTCQAGACTGNNPVSCGPMSMCHEAGVCDPSTGTCTTPLKANGSACNDGNACTRSDTCQAGACQGANPVDCTVQSQCHLAGTCDPVTGACTQPQKPDGASCDDGSLCTRADVCQAGQCQGTEQVTCVAVDECHAAGTCNPRTGICSNPQMPNGSACNDGNACTRSDTCQAGICAGANPMVCDSGNECEEASACVDGQCAFRPRADGTPCSKGTCQAGTCVARSQGGDGGDPANPGSPQSGCGCGAAEGGSTFLAALLFAVFGSRRRRH